MLALPGAGRCVCPNLRGVELLLAAAYTAQSGADHWPPHSVHIYLHLHSGISTPQYLACSIQPAVSSLQYLQRGARCSSAV